MRVVSVIAPTRIGMPLRPLATCYRLARPCSVVRARSCARRASFACAPLPRRAWAEARALAPDGGTPYLARVLHDELLALDDVRAREQVEGLRGLKLLHQGGLRRVRHRDREPGSGPRAPRGPSASQGGRAPPRPPRPGLPIRSTDLPQDTTREEEKRATTRRASGTARASTPRRRRGRRTVTGTGTK